VSNDEPWVKHFFLTYSCRTRSGKQSFNGNITYTTGSDDVILNPVTTQSYNVSVEASPPSDKATTQSTSYKVS